MDKKTVLAIILITLSLSIGFIVIPNINAQKQAANQEQQTEQVAEQTQDTTSTAEVKNSEESTLSESNVIFEEEKEVLPEETFIVKTNKIEVVLTNKGGDIISYKLLNHNDKDTNDFIQLSDSITDINRTCSIAFGSAEDKIVNDTFIVEKIDDLTYLFTKEVIANGKKVTLGKKYTFKEDEYMFKLEVLMHDKASSGLNINGKSYTLRTSPQLGPHFNPKQSRYENRQFIVNNGKKTKKNMLQVGKFDRWSKDFIYGGIAGKYFIEIVIPVQAEIINDVAYSTLLDANEYSNAQALIERKSFAGENISDTYYCYFGPREEKELAKYNVSDKNAWGLSGKKLTECLQSSGFLSWLEVILKFCLELIHKLIKNWGACIIILTLILRLALFPLSKKQSLSSIKMQEIQPKMQAIQKKYANDQQKMQLEMSKLYKEANYNPAAGCLPLILQMLILISMYNLFNNYFEFRGASFIPGWISDLSAPDSVCTWEKDIPVLGTSLSILPIIYLISQLISGKISQGANLNPGGQQSQATMKFMMYGMPIIFFFVLYTAPSGLVLYWLVSNIFQIVQQIFINKFTQQKRQELAERQNKAKKTK